MQLGSAQPVNTKLVAGGIEMDDRAKEVTLDGEAGESDENRVRNILKLLMEHKGEVFSPNQIYEEVMQRQSLWD